MDTQWKRGSLPALFASVLIACASGSGDGPRGSNGNDMLPDGGTPADGGEPSMDATLGGGGGDGDGGPGTGDGGPVAIEPCEVAGCGPGQRCDIEGTTVSCVDMTCDELACDGSQLCASDPAGGHVCASTTCDGDADCLGTFHCASSVCEQDACVAGVRTCMGNDLRECSSNGAQNAMQFSCGSPAHFTSICEQDSAAEAGCSCEDDWDCPAYTVCEVGRCAGTGVAPTCSLPAIPFSSTPPAVELHWGGNNRDDAMAHDGTPDANTVPWPDVSQVADTPMVANLDDDNGDGLINELDFPEIVFVTHKANNPWTNGILRAIHGGGPHKGADYFARCGDKLWTESAPINDPCGSTDGDADSGAPVAIADIDGDGKPEIVYTLENTSSGAPSTKFRILDNTGAERYTLSVPFSLGTSGAAPSIANVDYAGFAEIIYGHNVYVLGAGTGNSLIVTHILSGSNGIGINELDAEDLGPMACVADIIAAHPGQEIVAGATLYGMPALSACGSPPCSGTLDVLWNGPTVAGNTGVEGEGYCAVADVWGPNVSTAPGPSNLPDGKPEVVLIFKGHLLILNGQTGELILNRDLGGLTGGAPNVDDFDGDGFLEIASALQDYYVVVDLQDSTGSGGSCPDWPMTIPRAAGSPNPNPPRNPGSGTCANNGDCDPAAVCNTTIHACVCLHNGWKRDSDDDSSRATSSSVFDFNGDGAAEVIYNDECDFRVYDGVSGEEYFTQVSRSRTLLENPVVADVDNDGNAEIVTVMNTFTTSRCDDDIANNGGIPIGPNGLRVWGDPSDTWVAARRIWNEQSYHVTNVTEGGGVPQHEAESWGSWNGRTYNTYRSQPRSFGVAPDLLVADVGVSSPDAKCGMLSNNIDISFEIKNGGDLRVGPGVPVQFYGTWENVESQLLDSHGDPLQVVLTNSLEPGKSVILSINFAQSYNGKSSLPSSVRVVVDPVSVGHANGVERECREGNNSLSAEVGAGQVRPDLTVEVGTATEVCPAIDVAVVVHNVGTATARHVVVRYYAGDPTQGGTVLHEQELADPIDPDDMASFTAHIPEIPSGRSITIYAVVDPDRAIDECNEANNRDDADNAVECILGPQ